MWKKPNRAACGQKQDRPTAAFFPSFFFFFFFFGSQMIAENLSESGLHRLLIGLSFKTNCKLRKSISTSGSGGSWKIGLSPLFLSEMSSYSWLNAQTPVWVPQTKSVILLGTVTRACNPSYSRGADKRMEVQDQPGQKLARPPSQQQQ
jgi:hypothetical protein